MAAFRGTIIARDGASPIFQTSVNTLASSLIAEVNAVHAGGFSLTGSTGASFFTGTNATDIAGVNSALIDDPSLVQAAGVSGAAGDNQTALALARIAQTKYPAFNNQTFNRPVARRWPGLGRKLSTVNGQLGDQQTIEDMLLRQRDAGWRLAGRRDDGSDPVSKAFAASARLITTVDEMLDTR